LYFQVATSFKKPKQIVNFEMDVPKTFIDIDTAVPFGVVINELLTNSFKYAFKDNIPSNIYIKLTKISESKFIFFYKDDGKGLPENINFEKLETLGLRLIKLLSKQIGGKVTYNYNLGAEFEIEFKPRVPIPQ
jgi:two-component sensor histidine kinase